MSQQDPVDRLGRIAQQEGQRRLVWWGLGAGLGCLGPTFVVLVAVLAGVVLLAGAGHWFSGLFGPSPPAIATSTSRPAEWLVPATADAEIVPGIPNTMVLAVINQASDGQVFGDRWYCANGQTTGEACHVADSHTHHVGIGYGLMGLNSKDIPLPANARWHSVSWNLSEGIGHLADSLRGQPYWQSALQAFHSTVQTPPGWPDTENYPTTIKGLVGRYDAGPTLGAWALAPWSSKTGQFDDPQSQPEWVFVIGAAPTGAPFSHAWRAPTVTTSYDPRTGKMTKTIQYHILSGHDLASPVLVVGTLNNGQRVTFDLSTENKNIPVWSGGTVFGAQVPLLGPNALTSITAYWPTHGLSDTIPWPEQASGPVGTVIHVPPTQAVTTWWHDIMVASHTTGVPADWIAAEMLNESGGVADAGQNGLAGAYGLMQLEPRTAQHLPGYYPGARQNSQENLILGAELLSANYAAWHSWRLASAAYYGGLGNMESDGVYPGITWAQAAPKLATVPDASSGNTLTMEAYANNIEASSQAVAAMAP